MIEAPRCRCPMWASSLLIDGRPPIHQPPEGIQQLRDMLGVARVRVRALGYPMPEETCR